MSLPSAEPGVPAAFVQEAPRLANTYLADAALRETLERLLPDDLRSRLAGEWHELGEQAAGPLAELARQAEAEPPRHVPFDAWGRRIDEVRSSPAWDELHRVAARWGLTAVPYEGRLGAWARLHQFALLHLYAPSSACYSCPLAMTDGAARTLLEYDAELAGRYLRRLTSRDPQVFWTSGQWMTESRGGSDVSGSATRALRGSDGAWRLFGHKWFTSAVGAPLALTLARPADDPAGATPGSRGLALFAVEVRREQGLLQGLRVLRLKDKLGTRALPTAELELDGVVALPVGTLGEGVKKIAPLLNLTRWHNAVNCSALLARLLQLARDYAGRRRAFGHTLAELPLQRETLAELQVEYEAALALSVECARLLGRVDAGEANGEERAALRLLTPLAKLATAKQAVAGASEALEAFGGAGYVEDSGLPGRLRDAQVFPIWEGTTNVLSLDMLRAAEREGVLESWYALACRRLEPLQRGPAARLAAELRGRLDSAWVAASATLQAPRDFAESAARRLAQHIAGLAAGLGLLEQADWALARGRGDRAALAAERWLETRLVPLLDPRRAAQRLAGSATLAGVAGGPAATPTHQTAKRGAAG